LNVAISSFATGKAHQLCDLSARCHAIASVSPSALTAALVTVTAKFVTALLFTVTTVTTVTAGQDALPVPEVVGGADRCGIVATRPGGRRRHCGAD